MPVFFEEMRAVENYGLDGSVSEAELKITAYIFGAQENISRSKAKKTV